MAGIDRQECQVNLRYMGYFLQIPKKSYKKDGQEEVEAEMQVKVLRQSLQL